MSDSAVKEPPKKKETSPSLSLSSLLDEVVLSCLARVSRSDHAALSLVSKRYYTLVVSDELYKTRSLMSRTEKRLYICASYMTYSNLFWSVLRRESETSDQLIQAPTFPSNPSQPRKSSTFVTLDWGVYVIGGFLNGHRTSSVLLLDCRTNTWSKVTSMSVARASAAAGVVDGKIYVFGGSEEVGLSNWAEVYNPKSQRWDALVPMIDCNGGNNSILESFVMDEKVYAVNASNECFWYSPREGKWGRNKNKCKVPGHCCVIEKLVYCCNEYGDVFWSDSENFEWKKVKGLPNLRIFSHGKKIWKLGNIVANTVVLSISFWGCVWCFGVSMERREEEGEIWGTSEWSKFVTPPSRNDADNVLYLASVNV